MQLIETPAGDPALIVGLPVGFVGAAEAKAALHASDLPAVTNRASAAGRRSRSPPSTPSCTSTR